MQVNIHEAKTKLSQLLELVEQGETVIIARDGRPVAELIKITKKGFPFGIAAADPLAPKGDEWWQSLSDEEYESWLGGKG